MDAFSEYAKRLGAYCRFECIELSEQRISEHPSEKEISAALEKEAADIMRTVGRDTFLIAMCVEGRRMSSEALATLMDGIAGSGKPRLCFAVGGSYGLDRSVKAQADLCLSMSEMTFPHHLARVMLAEQIYRCFKINEGSRYHK